MKKNLILRTAIFLLGLMSIALQTQAQMLEEKEFNFHEAVEQAQIIVEGKIIAQSCYWSDDRTKIFTKSVIEIYKNFKGAEKMPTIELTMLGGHIDNVFQEVSDMPHLFKGQFGIFFLGKYEQSIYLSHSPITYYQDKVNPVASTEFTTMKYIAKEIYQPLQNECGQAVERIKSNGFEQNLQAQLQRRGRTNLQQSMEFGIEFSFDNVSVTFANGLFLEFDISLKEVIPTLTKFAKSELYLKYNSLLFGQNIAASQIVQLTKGAILAHPDYSLSIVDDSPDKVKIAVESLGNLNLSELSTAAEQFIHAKINVTNIFQSPDITFEENDMQGKSYFATTTAPALEPYPYVIAEDSIQLQEVLAKPVISDFYPRRLRAGTFDTLTITGGNFGNVMGKLWFPDASASYGTYMRTDSVDIILWTNTMIKTLIPSCSVNGCLTAGSGRFIVEAASSAMDTTKSRDSLDIVYAVQNTRLSVLSNYKPLRVNLVDTNKAGGYTFRFQPDFRSRTNAVACFNEALKTWRCATGVNFVTSSRDTTATGIGLDGVSLIRFAVPSEYRSLSATSSPNSLAFTVVSHFYTDRCLDNTTGVNEYAYMSEVDMVFKDSINLWYINTNPTAAIPAGQFDFLSICMHEQGHAHRLFHATGGNKVMNPFVTATVRKRNLTNADSSGGINIVDFSTVRPNIDPFYHNRCNPKAMRRVSLFECATVTSNQEIRTRDEYKINCYPNPTAGYQTVKFELNESKEVKFSIYNLLGELVSIIKVDKYGGGVHSVEINHTDLPVGIYLLQINIGQESYSTKFVKSN